MFLLLLIPVLLIILAYDAPRLVKEAMWRELAVFLLIWSFGSFLSVAAVTGMELPNPNDLITAIFGFL
jgi:hypothetical protein